MCVLSSGKTGTGDEVNAFRPSFLQMQIMTNLEQELQSMRGPPATLYRPMPVNAFMPAALLKQRGKVYGRGAIYLQIALVWQWRLADASHLSHGRCPMRTIVAGSHGLLRYSLQGLNAIKTKIDGVLQHPSTKISKLRPKMCLFLAAPRRGHQQGPSLLLVSRNQPLFV